LSDQVISLAVIQQGQLVDVETVAHLREFLKIINKTNLLTYAYCYNLKAFNS
jgi:hypothetical protein